MPERASAGERLRDTVLGEFELEPDRAALLDQAAAVVDRIVELERRADTDGLVQQGSTGQPIVHPAVAEARQQRALLQKLLAAVGLPAADDGSSWDGVAASTRARRAALTRWSRNAG